MKNPLVLLYLVIGLSFINCSGDSDSEMEPEESPVLLEAYFPPTNSNDWETISLEDLEWDETAITPLLNYLEEKDTKSFLVIKDGNGLTLLRNKKIILPYGITLP